MPAQPAVEVPLLELLADVVLDFDGDAAVDLKRELASTLAGVLREQGAR